MEWNYQTNYMGNSSSNLYQITSDKPDTSPYRHSSAAEVAEIISKLSDKSVDEIRKLLNDKEAYEEFFCSLVQVKKQHNSHDETKKKSLQLASDILDKEPRVLELKNQCIIRTTELAAVQEKLNELEKQKEETLRFYSPESLLQKLHVAMEKADRESEALEKQLTYGDIELSSFVQKYKSLRTIYHQRSLVQLAAKTCL